MRNKHKWYSILLIGLVILVASSFVACGECYTQKELDTASEAAYTKGYDIGLAEGESNKEEAAKEAYDKGYERGQIIGYDEGHDKGYETGYQNGFWAGEDEALKPCRDMAEDNYYQGYAEGLAACQKIPFQPPPSLPCNVQITKIFYDGLVYRVESDEYVEIKNLGNAPQDLKGWVLKDISEGYPSFTFRSYILAPGVSIRVYTNEVHPETGGFRFGYGQAIWNNTSPDTAALYNAQGQLVSTKSY